MKIVYIIKDRVLIVTPKKSVEYSIKDVPDGAEYSIVDDDIVADRTFRDAWTGLSEDSIEIDIEKAKEIAHKKRREARTKEFTPLDIKATIPLEKDQAEQERVSIREKYSQLQIDIDDCETIENLTSIQIG